jgi:hypothetical protein
VIKRARAGEQARFDVAQALAIGELRKDHHHEVVVGGQRLRLPRHRVSLRATSKLLRVHPVQNLGTKTVLPWFIGKSRQSHAQKIKSITPLIAQ